MGTFLQKSRHGTVFYFRRRVPPDLRAAFGVTQIFVSLGTKDRPRAIESARWLAVRCDEMWAIMRRMTDKKSSDAQNHEALRRLIEKTRAEAPLKEEIQRLRDDAVEKGYQHNKSVRTLEHQHTERMGSVIKSIVGSPGNTTLTVDPESTTDARSVTIGQAIARMFNDLKLSTKTRKRYRSILGHFSDFVGSKTVVAKVSQSRFAEYAKHVTDNPNWKDKTKQMTITIAGRLFTWARGNLDNAPSISGATLKPTRDKPAHLDRGAFTLDEIGVLFRNVAPLKDTEPYRFWATVGVAFLGCRLQELAQADLHTDFKHDPESDAWYLSVNGNTGPGGHVKTVKTLAGWRSIPLHSALLRHGFIDYMNVEKAAGSRTLFERHWTPLASDRPHTFDFAHGITKWGSRTRARLAKSKSLLTPKTTYFHSLRHTFTSHLAKAGISEEMRAAITGQEYGGVNATTYAKLQDDVGSKVAIIEKYFGAYVDLLDAAVAAEAT